MLPRKKQRTVFSPLVSAALSTLTVLAVFLPSLAHAIGVVEPPKDQTFSMLWIDFEQDLQHGQVVSDQLDGVVIDALNDNREFDIAVAFDTHTRNTSDRDLEARLGSKQLWSSGNIRKEDLGTILILQENDAGCDTGICSDPDDEGQRPAGDLSFVFDQAIIAFGFDLIDIESLTAERATIEFFDGESSAIVSLMEYLDPAFDRYDASIELGDNSANRFKSISASSVGLSEIDRVTLHLGGSGGIDNIHVKSVIPEPSTALLMALGLGALAARRRD